jgi:phosphohistidine phosphatase SixA
VQPRPRSRSRSAPAGAPPRSPSAVATTPSPQKQSPADSELLRALRAGGFVIYFRHAATDPASDTDYQNLANCSAQRNLSERGREQARRIGSAFRELGIPVGTVQSSAFCRTLETANLAFGRAEQSVDLTSLPQAGSDAEEERRVTALRELLATPPPAGQNTVLVGHLFNIQRAAGISIAEGEAAVIRPREGGYDLVSTVPPEQWEVLGR